MLRRQHLDLLSSRFAAVFPEKKVLAFCEKYYGLKVDFFHQSYEQLGGDVWGIFPLTQDEIIIYLFDFLGHDAKAAHNALSLHAMARAALDASSDPAVLLTKLNENLRASPMFPTYVTMFIAIYDARDHRLRCSNASGPPFYGVSSSCDVPPKNLTTPSLPLGASASATYPLYETILSADDTLVLYSDALTETRMHENGDFFELLFEKMIHDRSWKESEKASLFQSILDRFTTHCKGNVVDDITLITLQITPDSRVLTKPSTAKKGKI
jgi:sigma-B regulation protein RsbU (phosphoserine phosphatase)